MKHAQGSEHPPKARINLILYGQPALWLKEWKDRGIVKSAPDAVLQAFQALHERIVERELRESQLKTMKAEE